MITSMSSALQPKVDAGTPGRSISTTVVPVSSLTSVKVRSPTHVWVAVMLTSRLWIVPLEVTSVESLVLPGSGMTRPGWRQISAPVVKSFVVEAMPVPQALVAVTRQKYCVCGLRLPSSVALVAAVGTLKSTLPKAGSSSTSSR